MLILAMRCHEMTYVETIMALMVIRLWLSFSARPRRPGDGIIRDPGDG